jgi:hypothetical protein
MAEVRLGVSVEPWTYMQPLVPAAYRTSGPHTVVVQVVEGEGAGVAGGGGWLPLGRCRGALLGGGKGEGGRRRALQAPPLLLPFRRQPRVRRRRPFPHCAARNLGGAPAQPPGGAGSPASPRRAPGANPFIQLQYDQATYATPVVYGTAAPVFLETFAFSENPSMLTRRVRLEAWSAPPAGASTAAALAAAAAARAGGGGGGAFNASFASLTSMDGTGARREYFGGTAVNLDLTTEGAVQDRWYALGGGEGGEVRVRLAVVAGGPEEEETQEVLDFCCGALGSSTREALLVEVGRGAQRRGKASPPAACARFCASTAGVCWAS